MIPIPPQDTRAWNQTNTGEILGNVFSSKNINFDEKGYARLAKRSSALISGVANFQNVISIGTLDGLSYLVLTSVRPFSITGAPGNVASDLSGSGHIGDLKFDATTWQNRWYVSQDTAFCYYDGSSWTTGLGSLTTGKYHPVCVHEGLNYLAIGDGNQVQLYDTSHTLIRTIVLPSNHEMRWIRYNNNYIYIGTRNISGGEAAVFIADGTSVAALYSFPVPNSNWVFSGCIYQGVLVIFSSDGRLQQFNGAGFTELAHLPVYDTSYSWYDGLGFVNGKIDQRGMVAHGEKIFIHLDGYIASPSLVMPNQPSGIWVFDPKVGLYHRTCPSVDVTKEIASSSINLTTNLITTGSTITAPTGTKVLVRSTDIAGLTAGKSYFIIVFPGATSFMLAKSYTDAMNANGIALGTGTTVTVDLHDDIGFGQSSGSSYQPGAICLMNDFSTFQLTYRESTGAMLFYGAAQIIPYDGSSALYTLQSFTTGENRGSVVSTKMFSRMIKDSWVKVFTKMGRLFEGNDKILVKVRLLDRESLPLHVGSTFTWTSKTTFTTSADLSLILAGDECEIVSGAGAGCCAHVVSATKNGSTWTVVLDETIPSAYSGAVSNDMIFQNWVKNAGRIGDYHSLSGILETGIEKGSSKWLQVKFEIRGVSEPVIEEAQVINQTSQPSA